MAFDDVIISEDCQYRAFWEFVRERVPLIKAYEDQNEEGRKEVSIRWTDLGRPREDFGCVKRLLVIDSSTPIFPSPPGALYDFSANIWGYDTVTIGFLMFRCGLLVRLYRADGKHNCRGTGHCVGGEGTV